MSQPEVYQEVQDWLAHYLRDNQGQPTVGKRALDRVTLLVASMLKAQHSAPAELAQAGHQLGERAPSAGVSNAACGASRMTPDHR